MALYAVQGGTKTRVKVNWVNAKCPYQTGCIECGCYGLKFMKEDVEEGIEILANDNVGRGKAIYTVEDIDGIREGCLSYGAAFDVFRALYKLNWSGDWYTFEVRKKNASCYSWITTSLKDWKDRFFLVDDRCVPAEMTWRLKRSSFPPPPPPKDFVFNRDLYAALIKEAGRVQKFPEHILVMGKISTIWSEPEYYPTLKWNGEVMGLKEALRLKSFDSTELDVRATRTPKGDPPYLTVVKENLYPIREPVATTDQGGSSSAPYHSGDKGKKTGSSIPKDSGSKVVLYGSEHLSVEDEGVNAKGNEDDAEVRPQVSFKRGRSSSSKPDPNPKKLKKTKTDLKTVVLEDEVDQVTGFSAAEGLLENLDAHLHGGKTPRDQPFDLPPS
ncbi:hypothetical protein Hanom_Chr06g00532351 [Helianthus anomalus]